MKSQFYRLSLYSNAFDVKILFRSLFHLRSNKGDSVFYSQYKPSSFDCCVKYCRSTLLFHSLAHSLYSHVEPKTVVNHLNHSVSLFPKLSKIEVTFSVHLRLYLPTIIGLFPLVYSLLISRTVHSPPPPNLILVPQPRQPGDFKYIIRK